MSSLLGRRLPRAFGPPFVTGQPRPPSTAFIMSAPAAQPSAVLSTSTSTSSTAASSSPSHVPECPRFTTIAVGERLYRQQVIPPPGGYSSSFHSSPTASSAPPTAAAARSTGTSAGRAPYPLPPPDESLLALVEEAKGDAGAVLCRMAVDVDFACLLSSISRVQLRAVEDIEHKHRTNIQLPMVTGADRESVVRSKQALDQLLTSLLADCPYTHFLSFPLPAFRSSLASLRSTILATFPTAAGLDPSIFVRPTSLHFTIAMLSLPTSHHVQRAAAALSALQVPMSDGLTVRLRGLAVMNDRPDAAHVMYIQPDESSEQRLTALAGRLVACMRQAGVLSDSEVRKQRLVMRDMVTGEERANVKWHATIINTKHRGRGGDKLAADNSSTKSDAGGGKTESRKEYGLRKRQLVDVSGILEQHGAVDWGEGAISVCELSKLEWDHSSKFYACEAKLML